MKRIFIALILSVIVILVYVFSSYDINKYYNEQNKKIDNVIELINNSKLEDAEKAINKMIDDDSLTPIIYKSDIEEIRTELTKAKCRLLVGDKESAEYQMYICKDLIREIHRENRFSVEKLY